MFVKNIRNTEISLGSNSKKITESEKINLKIMKRSIVSRTFLKKGSKLKASQVTFKRPLNGIPAGKLSLILSKILKKNILPNTLLKKNYFK
jgi:sialic acid synthase SpsE